MNEQYDIAEITKLEGILLGAALGDALGWPHEDRARRSGSMNDTVDLEAWTKRSGGRFQPHEERIEAGQYSDDTQLLVAVARARSVATDWWKHFARVELPFWTLYQRGGGGATMRAARSWLKGTPPWDGPKSDKERYFAAGGNGVAMRVAPHAIVGKGDLDFSNVASDVFADGVITHGHPVALVGALAYAFAVWTVLRLDHTLGYGELIDLVENSSQEWSGRPAISGYWPTWHQSAAEIRDYDSIWNKAVTDLRRQLEVARKGMSTGALALDEETLEGLGCFDKKISGAGTVSASAAIFLASKHAAAPLEGVMRAAFAKGADTDTIASMTGAIVGGIAGWDWMRQYLPKLQDTHLLLTMAQKLNERDISDQVELESVSTKDINRVIDDLSRGKNSVQLPIGFKAKVVGDGGVIAKGKAASVASWQIKADNDQTFILKKFTKTSQKASQSIAQSTLPFRSDADGESLSLSKAAGISLLATDISASRYFYSKLLGLKVTRQGINLVQFDNWLVFRQNGSQPSQGEGSIIYVEVKNLEQCHDVILDSRWPRPSAIEDKAGRRSFSCRDPDGRTIDVFEK